MSARGQPGAGTPPVIPGEQPEHKQAFHATALAWLSSAKQKTGVGEPVERLEPSCVAGRDATECSRRGKCYGGSKKLNIGSPRDPATPLLGIHAKEMRAGTPANVYSTVHEEPEGGSKASVHQRVNGSTKVVHPDGGILFRLKKEGSSDTCYSVDEPRDPEAE